MKDEVATSTQLQQGMRATGLFPNMAVRMVAIGEESGSLDDMLGKVADFYEAEVDNLVDGLSSLLEPLIMAVLGVLVGGLVIAMYLPIFNWRGGLAARPSARWKDDFITSLGFAMRAS
jgi:type IV pilus assembly protein PilC